MDITIVKFLFTMATWDDFKKDLKKQFYPKNLTMESREVKVVKRVVEILNLVRRNEALNLKR